jgi:hypothetical protein
MLAPLRADDFGRALANLTQTHLTISLLMPKFLETLRSPSWIGF